MDSLTTFNMIAIPAMLAISFGLGFYIGERGISGVKIDLANTKLELEKVKNLVIPQKISVVVPVASGQTPDTNPVNPAPSI